MADFLSMNLQFGPWLMTQISSGKYPGLEWIDGDKKTMFKIPWTKMNYPKWEEHHKIFQAWAEHRALCLGDTTRVEQSCTQIKSNFRTILRKCVEMEEVKDAHQSNLQTGNYKVYRILSRTESIAKRKSQQKTRKLYKQRYFSAKVSGDILDICDEEDDLIAQPKRKYSKLKSCNPETSDFLLQDKLYSKITRTISTQTNQGNYSAASFVFEPAAFEEADSVEVQNNSPEYEREVMDNEMTFVKNVKDEKDEEVQAGSASNNIDGVQLLLEAAQMAGDSCNPEVGLTAKIETAVQRCGPSIVDVLVELKISPEELFTYEMSVRYETRQVMEKVVLNDMSYGYKIQYGYQGDKKQLIHLHHKKQDNSVEEDEKTPVVLPECNVPAGNDLYTVLKNIQAGLILKSDGQYTLRAKRLCMSRVYAFTSYGDEDTDTEPVLLPRGEEVRLFCYRKFLKDWHHFLIEGSPKPNHEINLAFGKKTKHRHSRAFVSVTLVPKAAETMLQKISENLDDSLVDNVLRLFSNNTLKSP